MSIDKFTPNEKNPRKIADDRLALLKQQLDKFGDISGVVANRRTGRRIGGHQRIKVFEAHGAKPEIIKTYETPTRCGTVAEGFVVLDGERYSYRIVDWPEELEREALLAANNAAGVWDDAEVAKLLAEMPDASLTGFTAEELADYGVGEKEPQIKPVTVVPPPAMAWALVGVPIEEFGKVQALLDQMPKCANIQTNVSDADV